MSQKDQHTPPFQPEPTPGLDASTEEIARGIMRDFHADLVLLGNGAKLSIEGDPDPDLLPDYDEDRLVSVAEVRRALGISMPTSGPLFDLLTRAER